MNSTEHPEDRSGDDGLADHESAANDRFIHGLLEFLHKDTAATRDARINAVLRRIGETHQTTRGNRYRLVTRLVPLATAAVLTLAVVFVVVYTPQRSAYAKVDDAIRATQLAPHLRYEIRITDPALHAGRERVVGAIDMRGELLLVQLEMPDGDDFIMGRDRRGEWSLRSDGRVERLEPRAAAPRWINLGDSTILVGGLDALLEELRNDDFSIEHGRNGEALPSGKRATQLVATRQQGVRKPGPDRVHIWIDTDTSLVETLELHWDLAALPDQDGDALQQRETRPDVRSDQSPPPPGDKPRIEGIPELLSERPQFRDEHLPPPPELIVFQRVESNELPDARFSPPGP